MKLRIVVEGEYEVTDEEALIAYGTTDPAECASIDRDNLLNQGCSLRDFEFDSLKVDVSAKAE